MPEVPDKEKKDGKWWTLNRKILPWSWWNCDRVDENWTDNTESWKPNEFVPSIIQECKQRYKISGKMPRQPKGMKA